MARTVVTHETAVPKMKRIGIIGGLGQWATLDIIKRILDVSAARIPQYGNRGYPPMDIRMVNRAPMLLNEDGTFPDVIEPAPELSDAARFIGKDADFIILLAHTPHLFAKQIEETAKKPFLSIIDVTINEILRRGCKRVGIIAIGLTLDRRMYQNPLEEKGIETVVIPKELSDTLDEKGIWAIQEGASTEDIGDIGLRTITYLREQNVDGIILACTELPILLGSTANDPDIINPSQILAEAAVTKALRKNSSCVMMCSLCQRACERISRHHLIPRTLHKNKKVRKDFDKDERHTTIPLCRPCHDQIHTLLSEKQLECEYHTLDALRSNNDIQRFIDWIKNKPVGRKPTMRKSVSRGHGHRSQHIIEAHI